MSSENNRPSHNPTEQLAVVASRMLEDDSTVFVGTGLPVVASMLAQKTHAPGLIMVFEAGSIGPIVPQLPISVGDSRTMHRAVVASSMHDMMSLSQAGYVDYGFIGGAQIDSHGNINTTVIGDHDHPKIRLPGSGGANDVASFSDRLIVIMRQSRRSFVDKLDFLTTPGFLDGEGARERAGLPSDTGPHRVITQYAVYDFGGPDRTMRLRSLHPGVEIETVRETSGFDIELPAGELDASPTPTGEEIRLLREEIDPSGIVIGR
ncbi:MAG: CoA-transferase [Polyangia bacterium]